MKRMMCFVMLVVCLFFVSMIQANAVTIEARKIYIETDKGLREVYEVQRPVLALVGGEKREIGKGTRLMLDNEGNLILANCKGKIYAIDGSAFELQAIQEQIVQREVYRQPEQPVSYQGDGRINRPNEIRYTLDNFVEDAATAAGGYSVAAFNQRDQPGDAAFSAMQTIRGAQNRPSSLIAGLAGILIGNNSVKKVKNHRDSIGYTTNNNYYDSGQLNPY